MAGIVQPARTHPRVRLHRGGNITTTDETSELWAAAKERQLVTQFGSTVVVTLPQPDEAERILLQVMLPEALPAIHATLLPHQ